MKIKWGVIGCGGIADRRTILGMMLADNAELVAVMDANGKAAEAVKEKYGAKYAFDNEADLLALDEIDAVYIASPVFCHKEQVIAAAKAKKHILVEKPMALTSKDSEELIEVCKAEGVKLGVGLMMRFHAYHQAMREIVSDSSLGYDAAQDRGEVVSYTPDVEFGNMYTKEIVGFGNAIINGTEPPVPAEDAVAVQKIVEAAYKASDERIYVTL